MPGNVKGTLIDMNKASERDDVACSGLSFYENSNLIQKHHSLRPSDLSLPSGK